MDASGRGGTCAGIRLRGDPERDPSDGHLLWTETCGHQSHDGTHAEQREPWEASMPRGKDGVRRYDQSRRIHRQRMETTSVRTPPKSTGRSRAIGRLPQSTSGPARDRAASQRRRNATRRGGGRTRTGRCRNRHGGPRRRLSRRMHRCRNAASKPRCKGRARTRRRVLHAHARKRHPPRAARILVRHASAGGRCRENEKHRVHGKHVAFDPSTIADHRHVVLRRCRGSTWACKVVDTSADACENACLRLEVDSDRHLRRFVRRW